jgi:hypothetical protein
MRFLPLFGRCTAFALAAGLHAAPDLRIPVFFEPVGSAALPELRFVSRDAGATTYLSADRTTTVLQRGPVRGVVHLTLDGASESPVIRPLDRQQGVSHYYTGADPSTWRTNVPHFGRVAMHGVYPGIDLVYHGEGGRLEYDFVVAPGADPTRIALRFHGAEPALNSAGDLWLETPAGRLVHHKPALYQTVDGRRAPVDGAFLLDDGVVRFSIGSYRRDLPLVIDPVVSYSTFLGGNLSDEITAIALSGSDAIVTGATDSTGFYTGTRSGETDFFVARINAAGNSIVYAVIVGGELADFASGIAMNGSNEVVVAGSTLSTSFPGSSGSFRTTNGGGFDAFVTRLNATTGALVRSTLYGGNGLDEAKGIAVTSGGSIVVAGNTFSTDLPLANAIDGTPATPDGFLAVFSADLTTLQFGTYLGGGSAEFVTGLALDSSGRAVIGGQTYSTDFPVQSALQLTSSGPPDGFLTRVDLSTRTVVNSTYLGGSGIDGVESVAADTSGGALATGFTQSTDFPTTAGAWRRTNAGGSDVFAVKLTGSTLNWGTLLGGAGNDKGEAIAAGPGGVTAVAATTLSIDFPTVAASQIRPLPQFPDRGDTVVATFNSSGNLIYSTYHAGSLDDAPLALAYSSSGTLFVGGRTSSADLPLVSPADASYAGFSEGFLAALNSGPAAVAVTFETSPAGRTVIVDDVRHTTPVTLQWIPGVTHRIDAGDAAFQPPNQTFVWSSWTGTPTATPRQQTFAAPSAPATYRANFNALTCTYAVSPSSVPMPLTGGQVAITVTAPANCPWSAHSNHSWIQGSATGRTGNGTVTFTVSPGTSARTGSVEVAFQQVSVDQVSGVPAAGSITPGFGTGATQTFAFTFSDPDGAADLNIVNVLINNAIDGRNACYLAYIVSGPTSGTIALVNDAGQAGGPFAGVTALPGSGSVSNSACTINAAASSASMSGATLTLSLNITFKTPFGGNKVLYLAARDQALLNSGWAPRGVWHVPGAPATSPSVVSLTPQRVDGNTMILNATFSDNNGFADLNIINVLINDAVDGRNACYLAIIRSTANLLVVNDAGQAGGPFAGNTTIPSAGTAGNSQCSINAAGSAVSGSGTTVTLSLSLSFSSGFRGDRIVYLSARDTVENNSGWQAMATMTIP